MAADDEVLQRLIQGVAHVDIAVGEGRAVVQDEAGKVLIFLQHFVVQVQVLPVLQHSRLPCRQTGLHGEVGLRGDDRIFVVHWNNLRLMFLIWSVNQERAPVDSVQLTVMVSLRNDLIISDLFPKEIP